MKEKLQWANLSHADLTGANLSHDDLSHADLSGADLTGANLSWANLFGVNLFGADLSGADLKGAKNIVSFQCGKLNRACYAVRHQDNIMFQIGCLWVDSKRVIEKIRDDYGENSYYERLVLIYADPDFWIENGHGELK